MGTYTFKDGSQKDLLNLTGTVPMKHQGTTYNIPICLWILDSHPFAPPLCFLKPSQNMGVRVGRHIDAQGRMYLPYLQSWSHPKSTVCGLIREMAVKFEEELPLYSVSAEDGTRQRELLSYISQVTDGVSSMEVKGPSHAKVTVIGGGDMALACLLAVSAKGTAGKLVLLDPTDGEPAGGATADLEIFSLPNVQVTKDFSAIAGSAIVIVTVNAWSNSQSYVGVLQSNVELLRRIVPTVVHHCPKCLLLVASQPVEIMTYVTWKLSGFPHTRVLGIGCNLDSGRFHHVIEKLVNSEEGAQDAWIIGEQSENKVAVWGDPDSSAKNQISGKLYPKIFQEQLTSRALEMLKGKGQRSWSVGLSVADITHTLILNNGKVHSVSTLSKGLFGVQEEVFLSIPCVLGSVGVMGTVQTLQEDVQIWETLQRSAAAIEAVQQQLRL
ncbi:ubiquitin-conjugating enzyme E2-like [Xenopus laevis]|nr:ubiquitin-conjugating enzyme E2-like [Xenopus laevis]AAI06380.1 MGC130949 protein [Xenopus laevis]